MTLQLSYLNKTIVFLSLLAACFLQIQADFFENDTYAGLRLSLADFILPVAGVLIFASLFLKQSDWPSYKIAKTYFWFAGMTVVLLSALYTGFLHQGILPHWGLYNKVLGWFVLMAYFLWGAWFAHNVKCLKIYKFFRNFVVFTVTIGSIGALIITLQDFHIFDGIIAYPLKGLMANRNAFGFLTLSATILIFFYGHSKKPLLTPWAEKLFWIILPLIHVQIGSRSCWILAIIQIIAFLFVYRSHFLKAVAPSFALGCSLVMFLSAAHSYTNTNFIFKQDQNIQFVELPSMFEHFVGQSQTDDKGKQVSEYKSDMLRLKINALALELWAKSPVFGTGLGTTQHEEPAKFGNFLDVVDSTPIWLLCETGLIGLTVFAAFFWLILFNLSRETEVPNEETRNIDYISIGIFLTFAVMSVMHEILYTRFLWFILGIAITVPATAIRMHRERIDREKEPSFDFE